MSRDLIDAVAPRVTGDDLAPKLTLPGDWAARFDATVWIQRAARAVERYQGHAL